MDPLADFLTAIRNAYQAHHLQLTVPYSRLKLELAQLLSQTGFVGQVELVGKAPHQQITLTLLYHQGLPLLTKIKRVSRPSRRLYTKAAVIPRALSGQGLTILSTSQGLMTDKTARAQGLGGEIICQVW